jgi:hypothetical protein
MTPAQIAKLAALTDKLVDVVVIEADPENWTGGNLLPEALSRDERGDRYWCKKNAAATLAVLTRVESLTQRAGQAGAAGGADDADPDVSREIARAEKMAEKRLAEMGKNVHRLDFVQKAVNGSRKA